MFLVCQPQNIFVYNCINGIIMSGYFSCDTTYNISYIIYNEKSPSIWEFIFTCFCQEAFLFLQLLTAVFSIFADFFFHFLSVLYFTFYYDFLFSFLPFNFNFVLWSTYEEIMS